MAIGPDKTLTTVAFPTDLLRRLDERLATLDAGAIEQASRGYRNRRSAAIVAAIELWLEQNPSQAQRSVRRSKK